MSSKDFSCQQRQGDLAYACSAESVLDMRLFGMVAKRVKLGCTISKAIGLRLHAWPQDKQEHEGAIYGNRSDTTQTSPVQCMPILYQLAIP